MKPTIEILIGSPASGSEAAALTEIVSAINAPALILLKFEVLRSGISRQIDFVVITAKRAELIELKHLTAPVKGSANGAWELEISPGVFEQYTGINPWKQAKDAKLALSDSMRDFARQRIDIPRPSRRQYYEQFDASVTIYPREMPGSRLWRGNVKAFIHLSRIHCTL